MKRWLISLLCICLTFSLTSCGKKEQTNDMSSGGGQPVQGSENTEPENMESSQGENGNLPDAAEEDSPSSQETSGEAGNMPVVYMTRQYLEKFRKSL